LGGLAGGLVGEDCGEGFEAENDEAFDVGIEGEPV